MGAYSTTKKGQSDKQKRPEPVVEEKPPEPNQEEIKHQQEVQRQEEIKHQQEVQRQEELKRQQEIKTTRASSSRSVGKTEAS